MKNSTDMRVIRSRTLMENALIFILENEGIKGLSVKNLCKIAGINRGTFYLHFNDIFHLIEETEFVQGLLNVFEPINIQELMSHEYDHAAYPPITKAFQYLHDHASFFKTLICSGAPTELRERLQYLVGTRMFENLTKDPAYMFSDYAIAYLGNAQFGIIQHWFMTNRELPPEDIARILTAFIRKSPCLVYEGY
ncbi:TetR family transcriptional regulator [Paenibacillus sp. P13VS]|nr:TetR family transcriptional regulator [Paenibacillus sp. P13VS]